MSRSPINGAEPRAHRKPVAADPRRLLGLRTLAFVYGSRLRVHAVQELLALLGIAASVALVFATLVANTSIGGSAAAVVRALIGPANLQLESRSAEGFDGRLLPRVERLPGVVRAAPMLEATGTLSARRGRAETVTFVGSDISLAILNGLAHSLPISTLEPRAIALSATAASAAGIRSKTPLKADVPVVVDLRGVAHRMNVAAVMGAGAVGPIADAYAGILRLEELQQLTGLRGRVSRILVQCAPGKLASVEVGLRAIAAGRISVEPADHDIAVLRQALGPSQLASDGFAVVTLLLGALMAFNAVLLTAPERRRSIAELRLGGATRSVILQVVLFQAACLGLAASVLGSAAGYLLATSVFHQTPGYLAEAFTLGSATVVGLLPLAVSVVGGIVATCAASAVLLLDLRHGRAVDAIYEEDGESGHWISPPLIRRLGCGALLLGFAALVLSSLTPQAALPATALLGVAAVLLVPPTFFAVLSIGEVLSARVDRLVTLPVVLTALRATTLRSVALMSTGAVALFGAVSLGGARSDLMRGLTKGAEAYAAESQIWVYNRGDIEQTTPLMPGWKHAQLSRIPGVAQVRTFQTGLFDLGSRRVAVFSQVPGTGEKLLAAEMVGGAPATADRRLTESGWVAVAKPIADELHTGLGGRITIPTPSGEVVFRIAALITNFGWPGGAIFIDTADYHRYWMPNTPTALGLELAPNASSAGVLRAARAAFGGGSALELRPARMWTDQFSAVAAAGLDQLKEIMGLLLLTAALAMSAALISALWQRRTWLAGLRLGGALPTRLRRVLLLDALLTLGTACAVGSILGVFGQLVLDGYFRRVTGFPVSGLAGPLQPLELFSVVLGGALLAALIPGWRASRVAPEVALGAS